MVYSFGERHDHLRKRMREVNSRTVNYRRKGRSVECSATVYETKQEDLVLLGLPLDVRRREYIVDLAELQEAGNPFEVPRQGDEIIDGGLHCQVVPRASDEPCFKFTTHRRDVVRIHTQVVHELAT